MNDTISSYPMATFKNLYEMMQIEVEFEDLQIFSNKKQVNILNDQGLSIMNIVFYPEEDRVTVFHCDIPGYCNYDRPYYFNINASILLSCTAVLHDAYLESIDREIDTFISKI